MRLPANVPERKRRMTQVLGSFICVGKSGRGSRPFLRTFRESPKGSKLLSLCLPLPFKQVRHVFKRGRAGAHAGAAVQEEHRQQEVSELRRHQLCPHGDGSLGDPGSVMPMPSSWLSTLGSFRPGWHLPLTNQAFHGEPEVLVKMRSFIWTLEVCDFYA